MNLILRYLAGRKAVPATADPHLKAELNQTKKDLNQILNKWKFGDTPLTTAQEFLANFEPWITDQLNQQKDLKIFLAKKGVTNLTEAESKLTNRDLSENEELAQFLQNNQASSLTEISLKLTNYEQKIENLKEQLATYAQGEDWESQTASVITSLEQEVSDLTTERDEAIREKKTAEQEALSLGNKLKLKSQEADNKSQEIERLKKEKSQVEIRLNKTITELRTKYSKQGKLLDEEQLETKKLEEKIETLEAEIQQLKGGTK